MTATASLTELGGDVEWPDTHLATTAARRHGRSAGRLADVIGWFAGLQHSAHPTTPLRPRLLVLAPEPDATTSAVAAQHDVATTGVDVPHDVAAALAAGARRADDEAESGTDLLMVAGRPDGEGPAHLVGLISNVEPVSLLPRGVDAVDTREWIRRAERLRDGRRRLAALRAEPDDLLVALDDAGLAYAVGLTLRAAARRTPLVLDGPAALAAAVLAGDVNLRVERWWRAADTSPHPVARRAVAEQGASPILSLDVARADGVAAVLAWAAIRAALVLPAAGAEDDDD